MTTTCEVSDAARQVHWCPPGNDYVRLLRNALQMRRGAMNRTASYREEK